MECGKEENERHRLNECEAHMVIRLSGVSKHHQHAVISKRRMVWERGLVVRPMEKSKGL